MKSAVEARIAGVARRGHRMVAAAPPGVRYLCVNPAHQIRRGRDAVGLVVVHSGTFGFCPCEDACGPHTWRPAPPDADARINARSSFR